MRTTHRVSWMVSIKSLCISSLLLASWAGAARAVELPLVEDFESGLPSGLDGNGAALGFATFQDPNSVVAISTTTTPPAPVPGGADPNAVLRMDVNVVSFAGFVHKFENAGVDTWVPQDWSAYEGLSFWLYGNNSGTTLFVDVLDNRNPGSTTDDAERWSIDITDDFSGWKEIQIPFASMHRKEIGNGAPNDGFGLTDVYGWALGAVTTPAPQSYYVDNALVYGVAPIKPLTVGFTSMEFSVTEGASATLAAQLSKPVSEAVTVQYKTSFGSAIANRQYTPVSGTLTFPPNTTLQSFFIQTVDDAKYQGERGVLVELSNPTGGAALGLPAVARLAILDNEFYDAALLEDFESYPYFWTVDKKAAMTNLEIAAADPSAVPGQGAYEHVLRTVQKSGKGMYTFGRIFPVAQNWSAADGIEFWFYGRKSNKDIVLSLDNDAPIASDPSTWTLVWADEFIGKPGTAPNANVWGQEIGDGTVNGIPGWGNNELEFYTGGTDNVAIDGLGNLKITVRQADGSLTCYYGPCEYTSARLLTRNRFEVAYGRVEARIKVPAGSGLWPAFWMVGTDIDQVFWPQAGEIDIMEHAGRLPNHVVGALQGPGYSGGQSYGTIYDFGKPVGDDYHVFAVEWQPDRVTWLVDGTPYFTATPDDPFLQGKPWVFNHPFFIVLNVAVGGNYGGPVGPETSFPQAMLVDYVRVYQTPRAPVSFTASFHEDFSGWKKIGLPFSAFQGADGSVVDTAQIKALRFTIPDGSSKAVMLDQLRLSCVDTVTVLNAADDGPGSLREALKAVCAGGTILFSDGLANQTITLLSGPLILGKDVTIDGSGAPGLALSGNNADRVFIINAGAAVTVKHLTVTDGYGWQLAGGILNNGALTLDHVTVTDNTMDTNAGDWWQGGGGIYSGSGATLVLIDSSVTGNQARWSGGGLYGFSDTETVIIRSTISGNTSNDVGGGLRSLGHVTITDSTISGNTATGWHGGAIFHTDGTMEITSSTIAFNAGPDWAPSAIFIGSFNAAVPTLKLTNTLITGNRWYACDHFTGTVIVTSGGHNLVQDDTCVPVASDLIMADAKLGPLADNGGPTLTHALLDGSPAIDVADDAQCSEIDQRGVTRPQGAQCDIGSYEAP